MRGLRPTNDGTMELEGVEGDDDSLVSCLSDCNVFRCYPENIFERVTAFRRDTQCEARMNKSIG